MARLKLLAPKDPQVVLAEIWFQHCESLRCCRVTSHVKQCSTPHRKLGTDGMPNEAHLGARKAPHHSPNVIRTEISQRVGFFFQHLYCGQSGANIMALPAKAMAVSVKPDLLLCIPCALLISELVPVEEPNVPAIVQPSFHEQRMHLITTNLCRTASGHTLADPGPAVATSSPTMEVYDGLSCRVVVFRLPTVHGLGHGVAFAKPIHTHI
mmetsp:Transcript_67364/g.132879  ORF Transcript_67364/g.132879 Transcript_67364/m.132879 type:complete len:210 (-) Transcript_67364:332-961(-)